MGSSALLPPEAAFSLDGMIVVSATPAGRVLLRDTATGQPIGFALNTGTGSVDSVAFSPDGATLAGSSDGTVRLFDIATGQMIGTPLNAGPSPVGSVEFSPDGRTLGRRQQPRHDPHLERRLP